MSTENEIRNAVYETIASTFGFPVGDIRPETTASDVEGWDSVSTSILFFSIEDRLGVELPVDQLLSAKNVGEMVAIVAKTVKI